MRVSAEFQTNKAPNLSGPFIHLMWGGLLFDAYLTCLDPLGADFHTSLLVVENPEDVVWRHTCFGQALENTRQLKIGVSCDPAYTSITAELDGTHKVPPYDRYWIGIREVGIIDLVAFDIIGHVENKLVVPL